MPGFEGVTELACLGLYWLGAQVPRCACDCPRHPWHARNRAQLRCVLDCRDRMIDQPTYLQARNLLQFAARVCQV